MNQPNKKTLVEKLTEIRQVLILVSSIIATITGGVTGATYGLTEPTEVQKQPFTNIIYGKDGETITDVSGNGIVSTDTVVTVDTLGFADRLQKLVGVE